MSLTFTREFRVRHYECDAFGHLNNANYLRYMQEAAFDASAGAGYDPERYSEIGHHWLIRETDIEYLKPLKFGDRVNVKTWVIDFHNIHSRRAYEFIVLGSDEIAAKAVTDWVYINSDNGRLAKIPLELKVAFFPEGIPSEYPLRNSFPSAPPPPEGVFEMNLRVAWQDIDSAQHVNNAVYLNYIDECGMQVIAAHGWPVTRMLDEGFAILIRRHQIQYRHPAKLEDELRITTWASDIRRSTATRHYKIERKDDNQQIAFVHSKGVYVNLESGRPARFPETFLADFAPNLIL